MDEDNVVLAETNPDWRVKFENEKLRLEDKIPAARIQHIGSTSIPGIKAKPVIDILVGVPYADDLDSSQKLMIELGYKKEGSRDEHIWLSYPSSKNRQYIVHLVIFQAGEWQRRLKFRDYLIANPEEAAEYENLKTNLAGSGGTDIDTYTSGKAEFVRSILEKSEN